MIKNIFILFSLFISIASYSQEREAGNALIAEFTYLLKGKIDKTIPHIHEETFVLQVLEDKAFFVSENLIKYDSILKGEVQRLVATTPKGGAITYTPSSNRPKVKFMYTIVQSPQEVEYFERVESQLFSYREPVIKDWKLSEETKTISTFHCKKATLHYKGRNWIAWYTPDIPLTYGPYKFTGLPGLLVKIESEDGEYGFELIKSSKDKRKELSVQEKRYKKPVYASFSEIRKMKKNVIDNMIAELSNMGVQVVDGGMETMRERQKQRLQSFLNENLIEKSEN